MKRTIALNGRRHGLRARPALVERVARTVLTFERRTQAYCWSTDRGLDRPVLKL